MDKINALKIIEAWQRRSIFAFARELGIKIDNENKNDELHDLVESLTGQRSVGKLTYDQADLVIGRLKGDMRGCGRLEEKGNNLEDRWQIYAFGLKERPGMASLKQLNFIRAMMLELKRLDPMDVSLDKRLRGWLEKYAHVSDVTYLTPHTAYIVTEGLKGCLTRMGWVYRR